MKDKKINIKTITIIVLIFINISFLLIILNMKNKSIEGQKIAKEQLEETTTDKAYISMSTHLSELDEKQQEINNMQNTSGQATVTVDKILKNYTAYKDGKLITGTMANNGAVTSTLNAGGSYTIPAGYHNGSGKVTANSLASQTSANATAADIASGKTAWVNGNKITGTGSNSSKKLNLVGSCNGLYDNKSINIDLSGIPNYQDLVYGETIIAIPSGGLYFHTGVAAQQWAPSISFTHSYNSSTGKLTITLTAGYNYGYGYNVYAIY